MSLLHLSIGSFPVLSSSEISRALISFFALRLRLRRSRAPTLTTRMPARVLLWMELLCAIGPMARTAGAGPLMMVVEAEEEAEEEGGVSDLALPRRTALAQ